MRRLIVLAVIAGIGCSGSSPRPAPVPAPPPPGAPPPLPGPVEVAHPAVDPAPPTFRLPGDVVPVRYRLEQTIVPDRDRVQGVITIDVTVKKPTRVVWLNARDIKVAKAVVGGKPARAIAGGENFIGLMIDQDLQPGASTVEVTYEAGIDHDKSRGIYSEREGNEPYVYTFFEPIDARRAFPCFDEPSYKVPWTLVFHVRKGDVARANAPIVKETDEAGGMKRVELAESKPLPSYLVAFVVGPFDVVEDGVAGRAKTPIAFIVPKGRADELAYAKIITPKVVVALENYFDMDYPYGKLDVAVVPRYWGTMEHPGIVAMGQVLTLIRHDEETRSRKQNYANILAHELSHYWFGDYVTMAWWDDTWLNEALGEWSDMNITDAVAPEWHYRDDRVGITMWSMGADETLAARPIHHDVKTTEEIEASFDNGITYAKGSSILRAAEALVGPEKFRAFIRAYVRKHAWGNASAQDFLGEARAQLGDQVGDMLQTYVTRPGAPLVDVKAECGPKPRIVIDESKRALPAGVTDPAPQPWSIPVCVRYGDGKHSDRACGVRAIEIAYCPSWIVPNADAYGYYRSVVIGKQPAVAKLTVAEKMMAFSDLRAMVARGQADIDSVLAAIPVMIADKDPRIARWALTASDLQTRGFDDALFQASRAWNVKLIAPLARALGWKRAAGDDDERHKLRITALGWVARFDPTLRAQAEKLADKWLADRKGIDDDLVVAVLTAAAHGNDPARFDRLLAAAKAPRDRRDQQRLVFALAAFTDAKLVQRALDLTLGGDFDTRETVAIPLILISQRETRDQALAFLQQHIDELLSHMRGDDAAGFLANIAEAPCDPERRKTVADLVTPRAAKFDGAQNAVAQALERTDVCIAETAREKPAFEKFFK
ncbi:MAG: M1 family metallopeptidase [Deltaproteobacteria bacterium]|nr:M1 family metallopeptidase [Deltaproteobacteria bacterium]